MSTLLEFSLFEFLKNALSGLGKLLTLDLIFYMFVGLEIVCIIYFIIKTHFSYELRLLRTLDKINLYLLSNPYIKEENLINIHVHAHYCELVKIKKSKLNDEQLLKYEKIVALLKEYYNENK